MGSGTAFRDWAQNAFVPSNDKNELPTSTNGLEIPCIRFSAMLVFEGRAPMAEQNESMAREGETGLARELALCIHFGVQFYVNGFGCEFRLNSAVRELCGCPASENSGLRCELTTVWRNAGHLGAQHELRHGTDYTAK